MSDSQGAVVEDGNTGFAEDWKQFARDKAGQAQAPQPDERGDDLPAKEPEGQDQVPPQNEAAPQEPAPAEPANDIWADAPEALRKAFEAERVARTRAENAVSSSNGRLSKAEREAAALRAQLLAAPPATTPKATDEDRQQLRAKLVGEYDEVNAPLADEILALRQTVDDLLARNASAEQIQQVQNELELKVYLEQEEAKLKEAHEDWSEVVLEPAFVTWVQTGPQFIKDGIARNANGIVDASEAAKIIDLFKAETGRTSTEDPNAARRQRQLEGARTVPARTPGATPSGSPDDHDTHWKKYAAQAAARARR